jgi:hypothetical protein
VRSLSHIPALIAALLICLATSTAHAEPRSKPVELHKRTNLVVYVVPDLGVRFTFPFILDEQDSYVPFTLNITNPSFEQRREKGRNYFVITEKAGSPSNMLGNVFITVAGFEISIELRTTNDLTKHYSDIVFDLTKEAREELIQQGIVQRTLALEQEYKKKFDDLDAAAEQKAIARVGRLALKKPDTKRIKEESRLKLPNGDAVVLFVDQVVDYEPYSIYLFNVAADSDSKGLTIMDARLLSVDAYTKQARPIDSSKDVPSRVQPNQEVQGAITVLGSSLNPKNLLRLQVVTDKGTVEAEW